MSSSHLCNNCSKSYSTLKGLKQHQSRYCRGIVDNICRLCHPPTTYGTYSGLRLHQKKSHSLEFNNSEAALAKRPATASYFWTVDEEAELARKEAEIITTENLDEILEILSKYTNRSKDAIRKRRLRESYKAVVKQHKEFLSLKPKSPVSQASSITTIFESPPNVNPTNRIPSIFETPDVNITPSPFINTTSIGSPELFGVQIFSSPTLPNNFNTTTSESISSILTNRAPNFSPDPISIPTTSPPVIRQSQSIPANSPQQHQCLLSSYIYSVLPNRIHSFDEEYKSMVNNINQTSKINAIDKYSAWICGLPPTSRPRIQEQPNHERTNSELSSRRRRRVLEYQRAQHLWAKNQQKFVRDLLDGVKTSDSYPSNDDFFNHFSETFGGESKQDSEDITDMGFPMMISNPVTVEEIDEMIKIMRDSSPGTDNLRTRHLRVISCERLSLLFNGMLLAEYTPSIFKRSRTILIPKSDEANIPGKWRPITISSIIIRLFHKIIAKRLEIINLNCNQRGFQHLDGVFANVGALHTIIKSSRSNGVPLSVVAVDIKQAFDTVSHQSIERAMRRVGVDQRTRNYIMNSYLDNSTQIEFKNWRSRPILVKKGVKQGDPMSPALFNFVMDEIICHLRHLYQGIQVNGTKVQCLAYADDLILLAQTPRDLQSMLNTTIEFLAKRGMSLNAKKCRSLCFLRVPAKKKIYVESNHQFTVNHEKIPTISVNNLFDYLGEKVGAEGIQKLPLECLNFLQKIAKAPLKPAQKLQAITKFILPIFISKCQKPSITGKTLSEIDRKVRICIKKILHLPASCGNAIFYTPARLGGLGVFNFRSNIPRILIGRFDKITAEDNIISSIIPSSTQWVNNLRGLIRPFERSKESLAKFYAEKLSSSFSGGDVKTFGQKFCNITTPPKFWSGRDFINNIQLRLNLLPVKSMPSVPVIDRQCRGCNRYAESLSHIIQKCPIGSKLILERHDFVQKRFTEAARKKGWTIHNRLGVSTVNGQLFPDVVLIKDKCVIVSDISVDWEANNNLDYWYREKQSKYSTPEFITALKRKLNISDPTIRTLPLIMGSRGGYHPKNDFLIDSLHLGVKLKRDLVITAMKGSLNIYHDFMRRVYTMRQRVTTGSTNQQ